MKRKTYLILIWSITLAVIIFSSTKLFVNARNAFFEFWDDFSLWNFNWNSDKASDDFGDWKSFNDSSENESENDFIEGFDTESNDDFYDSEKKSGRKNHSKKIENFNQTVTEFSKINLEANIMSLKIKKGSEWRIDCNFSRPELKPQVKIENGVLKIKQKVPSKPKLKTQKCDLTVIIPSDAELSDVSIKINVGELKISDINIHNIDTHVNIGEVKFDNVQFERLKGELNIGDFNIDGLKNFDEFDANLDVSVGSIEIGENGKGRKYSQKRNNTERKKIDVSVNIGEVEIGVF